jgi:hypothetical protein
MAMNGSALGDSIYSALKSTLGWSPSGAEDAAAEEVWQAIGGAIVAHIQANALVVGTATGVTSGPAAAPVSGTIS